MSYLTDAVTEITTDAENGAMYHVGETEHVELVTDLDAAKYAERLYRRENHYDGYVQTVAQEVDDGYNVMVMETSA